MDVGRRHHWEIAKAAAEAASPVSSAAAKESSSL
jgi:hypothetical protein